MMKKHHRWIFGRLLLLSSLLIPIAGFAEEEPVSYPRSHFPGSIFITTNDVHHDLFGFDTPSLYRHAPDKARTVDQVFRSYGYRSESHGDTRDSAIGPPPPDPSTTWPLDEHATFSTTVSDPSLPMYQYSQTEGRGQSTLNVLGEPLSPFPSRSSLSESSLHAFPPYRYQADYRSRTYSVTEVAVIIGAHVVLGILFPNCEPNTPRYPGKPFDYRCDR